MGGFIGSGSFGQVYKAMEVNTGRIIAVKKIPYVNELGPDMMTGIDVNILTQWFWNIMLYY
jgi:serine/threonine protein kinase